VYGLNVGVIGGGLGGLAVAIALQRAGHQPTVFEQTDEFRPVGAGISLWPNGVKVLNLLGLGDRVAAAAGRMDRMRYADRHGEVLTDFSLLPLYDDVGQRAWPLPRSELQEMLLESVGPDRVRFGQRCVSVSSEGGSARASFADGSTYEFDLVVAADGTHSALRAWVAGRALDRQYVGYVNFNGIASPDLSIAPAGTWVTWVGEGKRASVMPCGAGQAYTFFDLPMAYENAVAPNEDRPAVLDELRSGFSGWAKPVQGLIGSLDPARVNRVLISDLPPVERWHRDRVVLLGDSVHAMAPDLGQGGCQALEDGLVLAHYLTSTNSSVEDALRRYQAERQPRTSEIVRRARKRAALTHGLDGAPTEQWYAELAIETGEGIIAGLLESVVTGPCR
jgi:FAD-dependent urate hydroxylase